MIVLESLDHISLGSSNLKKSIEFYVDVLDFEVAEETDRFAILQLDHFCLRLNHIDGYVCQHENPSAFSLSFIVDVDDFTNAIAELEEKDIPIVVGPVVIEGGESMVIRDPDGNWIELFYREP
jgi:catechol 2,3-dioxygenase-like lactoylglutathione lyase family enzyme